MLIADNLQSAVAGFSSCAASGQRPAKKQDSKMVHLPELCSNLISALASLDVHNLPHGCEVSRHAGLPSLRLLDVASCRNLRQYGQRFQLSDGEPVDPEMCQLGQPNWQMLHCFSNAALFV